MKLQISTPDSTQTQAVVLRPPETAFLPAIVWDKDPVLKTVLPQFDANVFNQPKWAWFSIGDEGQLRQILRIPNDDWAIVQSHILYDEQGEPVATARVTDLNAQRAVFTVLFTAPANVVRQFLSLVDNPTESDNIRQSIKAASEWLASTYAELRPSMWYHISFVANVPVRFDALRQLLDRLPHDSGWNGTWYLDTKEADRCQVSIEYEVIGAYETRSMGWTATLVYDKTDEHWSIVDSDNQEAPWWAEEDCEDDSLEAIDYDQDPGCDRDLWERLCDDLHVQINDCLKGE